jgi:hypothetical protein
VNLDGRTLEHIGTGYATNYIDVSGTSVYGGTVRATLVFRIELEKCELKFNFDTGGAPTSVMATYELMVDDTTIIRNQGTQTITYVSYSQHDISVKAVVTTTSSYDQQTVDVNIVADGSIIDPNYGQKELILPGNYGQFVSEDFTTRFMGSGTVVVSFTWTPTYVYNLTTTQAGCTVVMCGVTITTNSVANHTYSMSSVESSMSYSVTKDGYYPESGDIIGPNRNVIVTLREITETYETVRTDSAQAIIRNNGNDELVLNYFTVELKDGDSVLGTWVWSDVHVPSNSSVTLAMSGYGTGETQVLTNTILDVYMWANHFNGEATTAQLTYPKWSEWEYGMITALAILRTGEAE